MACSANKDKLLASFREYDKDGNGTISLEEAQSILSEQLAFTEESTKKCLKTYDKNKDGKLSYEEFADFYFKIEEK